MGFLGCILDTDGEHFRTADELPSRTLVPTGDETLDRLLGGGLELGKCHLFYGDRILHEVLLRRAVAAQTPRAKGGWAARLTSSTSPPLYG
jgi:hypothetical protein